MSDDNPPPPSAHEAAKKKKKIIFFQFGSLALKNLDNQTVIDMRSGSSRL